MLEFKSAKYVWKEDNFTIYVKAKAYSMYIGPKQIKIPHFIMLKSVWHNIVL